MENNLLASNSDNILSANSSYFYENSCPKNSNFTSDLNSLMPIDYNEHFTGGKYSHFSNQSLSSPTEEPQEFAPQIYNNNQLNHTFYTNETVANKYINSNYTELLQDHELKLMEAHQNQQRQSANARERSRTFHVNKAFTALRELIPTKPANRKLSKIETLHLAISYIAHLGTLLELEQEQEQEELYEQKNDFQGALTADTFSTKQSINNSKQHKRDCHQSPDNRDDDNGHTDIMINCGNNKKIKLSSNNLEQVRADTRLVLRSSHRKLKKYLEKSSFTSSSSQKYNYKNHKSESNTYSIIQNHYDNNISTSPFVINCKNTPTHMCGTQNSMEENKDCLLSNPTTTSQMSITLPVRYCTFCAFNNLLQT